MPKTVSLKHFHCLEIVMKFDTIYCLSLSSSENSTSILLVCSHIQATFEHFQLIVLKHAINRFQTKNGSEVKIGLAHVLLLKCFEIKDTLSYRCTLSFSQHKRPTKCTHTHTHQAFRKIFEQQKQNISGYRFGSFNSLAPFFQQLNNLNKTDKEKVPHSSRFSSGGITFRDTCACHCV